MSKAGEILGRKEFNEATIINVRLNYLDVEWLINILSKVKDKKADRVVAALQDAL